MVKKGLDWFREAHCKNCESETECFSNIRDCIEAEKVRLLTKIYDEGDF